MGQAIQTITAASQGITSAESLVNQMQSVATTASQSLGTTGSSGSSTKEAVTATATGYTAVATANGTNDFRTLVDSNKNSLGIANGDTFTVKVDAGHTYTFTVGGSIAGNTATQSNGGGSTIADLSTWLSNVDGTVNGLKLTEAGGVLTITTTDASHTLTVGGTLATELGIAQTALSTGGTTTVGTTGISIGTGTYSITQLAGTSTLLSELTNKTGGLLGSGAGSAGSSNYAVPGGTLVFGSSTITTTAGMTVQDLLTQIDNISGLSATYSPVDGILVSNTTGVGVTISGTAIGLIGTVAAVIGSSSTNVVSTANALYQGLRAGGSTGLSALATYTQQFDTLRSQLDSLVQDASYQGVNLIAGSGANPLTVQFNNNATNPNKLVIQAVDLTTTGLGIGAASANWSDVNSIQGTLSQLTNANSTLRTESSTFGQNLTTVQTRQDFTTNLINTLQTGAGDLTNADMNTESANMLALQTQQQLGISSLSLASQAAQSILKLFP